MMTTAILIAFPILAALSALLKKKWLICAANGALVFVSSLLWFFAKPIDEAAVNSVGFSFFEQLLALLFPDKIAVTIALSAIFAVAVAAFLYSHSADSGFSAVLFAVSGLQLYFLTDPITFIAAALCACALKYASQRDFVRFAALLLLAVCFRPEMWAVILLFPFFAAPVGLPLLLVGIAAGAAVYYINPADFLFQSMSADARILPFSGASVLVTIGLFALFLIVVLTRKMFRKGTMAYSDVMTIALFAAAVLSLMSVSDIRFLPLMTTLAAPAVLSLGGELFLMGKRLIAMTFRENKRTASITAIAITAVLAAVWYAVLQTGVIE